MFYCTLVEKRAPVHGTTWSRCGQLWTIHIKEYDYEAINMFFDGDPEQMVTYLLTKIYHAFSLRGIFIQYIL